MRIRTLRILFVLLLFRCVSPNCIQAEEVDLILVAGQSNAVGYDAKPSLLPADERDREVLFWWRCGDPGPDEYDSTSGGKWTHLQPQPLGKPLKKSDKPRQYGNFAQADGGFGPEIGLARTLLTKEKRRLAIVKAAWSGTGIATDWDPQDTGVKGACFRGLIAETKLAIADANEQGVKLRPRAIVWVQGESDANPADAAKYAERLSALMAAVRTELNAPKLVALVGINTRFIGLEKINANVELVIKAQKEFAGKDGVAAYVDTDGVSHANAYHYDAAGTLEVGKRFAEALLKIEARLKDK